MLRLCNQVDTAKVTAISIMIVSWFNQWYLHCQGQTNLNAASEPASNQPGVRSSTGKTNNLGSPRQRKQQNLTQTTPSFGSPYWDGKQEDPVMPRNIHLPGGLIESHRIITLRPTAAEPQTATLHGSKTLAPLDSRDINNRKRDSNRLKSKAIQDEEHADIKEHNVEKHDSFSNSKKMSHSSHEVRDRRLVQRLCPPHIAYDGTQGWCVSVCVRCAVRQGGRDNDRYKQLNTHTEVVWGYIKALLTLYSHVYIITRQPITRQPIIPYHLYFSILVPQHPRAPSRVCVCLSLSLSLSRSLSLAQPADPLLRHCSRSSLFRSPILSLYSFYLD